MQDLTYHVISGYRCNKYCRDPRYGGHYTYAADTRWEPWRRLSHALWLLRTNSRRRVYHALHMLVTGEF